MTLVKFYAPNGVMLSEILHSCFCSHYNKTDVEVQQELQKLKTSVKKFHMQPFMQGFLMRVKRTEKEIL